MFEYEADHPFGLYGSIPLLLAHKKGRTTGAFLLNSAETWVDVWRRNASPGTHTQWIAESGVLDLFLLLGPTPAAVAQQYARLTGTTALPQLFSLGYHQCRWNYRDQEDVKNVDAGEPGVSCATAGDSLPVWGLLPTVPRPCSHRIRWAQHPL